MNLRARPFSNGTEYSYWRDMNCDRCAAVACGLQQALRDAYWDDGNIDVETAQAFGASFATETSYLRLPRSCGRFERGPICEALSGFGRQQTRCGNPAVVAISEGGYTYSACEDCAQEYHSK